MSGSRLQQSTHNFTKGFNSFPITVTVVVFLGGLVLKNTVEFFPDGYDHTDNFLP